jgi:hypothetical protein
MVFNGKSLTTKVVGLDCADPLLAESVAGDAEGNADGD